MSGEAQVNTASIEIKRVWDGKVMQTEELLPERCAAALIGYKLDLVTDEGGLATVVAAAVARGLTESGVIAGRWFDEDVSGFPDAELWPPERRTAVERMVDRVRNTWPSAVVTTRSADVVAELLDRGWEMQYQALLVLDESRAGDMREAVRVLRVTRDWRRFSFFAPVRALVAPGVDGDFIVVAAASEESLAAILGGLVRSFREAGFQAGA